MRIGTGARNWPREGIVASDSKARLLHDAEKYVLQGKSGQAIGEYLKIIKIDPNDVLTLNTIGDLYLRQNNISEAKKYFSQVAENYVRNNFFLKAIAVYKKVLSADPNNFEINLTMASLYAKQGLSIDARNQYMKVAAMLEKEGRAKEVLEILEKVVELDPTNYAIQGKLAELSLAHGDRVQAQAHFIGAARARAKAGDLQGAADCFSRVMQLDPLNVEAMRGFLDCCLKMGNVSPALDQLNKSIEKNPQNLDMREMLGQALLEAGDPEEAAKAFQVVVSLDEARYEGFFAAAQMLIDRESYDQAVSCLDSIIPILITRRETERAAQLYDLILQRCPTHVFALVKLASIYSATGDHYRYMEALDKIADHYLSINRLIEALEYLDKILQADPESEKHRKLHQQTFTEAYPDTPYVPPVQPAEPVISPTPAPASVGTSASHAECASDIVEVDLLLNYGLKDKALSLLQSLELRDPADVNVHSRLLAIYKAEGKFEDAAKQCLLLTAIYHKSKENESAQVYLNEAKELCPELVDSEPDLEAFARRNGVFPDALAGGRSAGSSRKTDGEVDLSADLMDIFFTGDQAAAMEDAAEPPGLTEVMPEDYPHAMPPQPPSKSVQEQLQEVDFYIRLGFHDEALAKLNEISKVSPDNPELASRYQKLGEMGIAPAPEPQAFEKSDEVEFPESAIANPPDDLDDFEKMAMAGGPAGFMMSDSEPAITKPQFDEFNAPSVFDEEPIAHPASQRPIAPPASQHSRVNTITPLESDKSGFQANEMFADLMDEVGAVPDQQSSQDSFENHFSLGTAYREMDLMDEAIQEFQNALKAANAQKDSPKIIQCCGMLSTCFLKKGMPRSALRWCQTGLGVADNSSHEALALRYDMGIAHAMSGSNERALECFDRIFGMDPSYRDVAQRIDELKSGFNRHAP
jgi:tetratricopeptide (TPR) repeat protein